MLNGAEKLCIALYLKAEKLDVRAQRSAATQAGVSPEVFTRPDFQEELDRQMAIRAKRLGVGSEWVLQQLVNLYERASKEEKVLDLLGQDTGLTKTHDMKSAVNLLKTIGSHCDIQAWDNQANRVQNGAAEKVLERLASARLRVASPQINAPKQDIEDAVEVVSDEDQELINFFDPQPEPVQPEPVQPEPVQQDDIEDAVYNEAFVEQPPAASSSLTTLEDVDDLIGEAEKMKLLMNRWKGVHRE